MTSSFEFPTRVWQVSLAGLALLLGVLAGVQPVYAAVAVIGALIVALTFTELAIGLCVLTIVAFLDVLPSYGGSLTVAKITGLLLALAWLMHISVRPTARRLWVRHPSVTVLLIAMGVWAVLSALWAEQLSSWLDVSETWVLNLALFPIVYSAFSEHRYVAWFFLVWIAGGILAAAYGLVSAPPPSVGGRLSGALGPNGLGNVMAVGTILAVTLAGRRDWSTIKRALALFTAGVCMVILFLTVSREAIFGLAVAIAVAPLVVGRRHRARALGLVIVALVVAFVYFAVFATPATLSRFSSSDPTGSGRLDIWKVGWRLVQAHPIVGVGAGNFPSSLVHYLLRPGPIQFSNYIVDTPKVAHNIYLQVLGELGIVGLLLLLGIFAVCLTSAWRAATAFSSNGDALGELLARGVLLALIALLAAEFFSSDLFLKQLWLLLATAPALLAVAETDVPVPHRQELPLPSAGGQPAHSMRPESVLRSGSRA